MYTVAMPTDVELRECDVQKLTDLFTDDERIKAEGIVICYRKVDDAINNIVTLLSSLDENVLSPEGEVDSMTLYFAYLFACSLLKVGVKPGSEDYPPGITELDRIKRTLIGVIELGSRHRRAQWFNNGRGKRYTELLRNQ